MSRSWLLVPCLLLLTGCALGGKNLSPNLDTDLNLGYNRNVEGGEGDTGGIAGKIGGDGDSVALWLAIGGLTILAFAAYPAQRTARLAWNSWRGQSGPPNYDQNAE